ncbi:MAG: hypothetical protein JJT82_09660 [Legionellaceae bacterium]|nr:hypothetical protein [Legionellaceae bacterium]
MRLPRELEDHVLSDIDVNYEEDKDSATHKRELRRRIEEQLERKRLREELEDDYDEFDWDDFDR